MTMSHQGFHGASLLLLNVPPQSLGGIDLLSFTTSPRFQGVKLLPPGLHFVFVSTSNSLSIRHGAWFRVEQQDPNRSQMIIKVWDQKAEQLSAEENPVEIERHRANLDSIWRESLTPYRQTAGAQDEIEEKSDWKDLTEFMSDKALGRITGEKFNHWSLTSANSAVQDKDEIPGLPDSQHFQRDQELAFLPINLRETWRHGATGRERTDGARDTSWALDTIITEHCLNDETEILSELQFCFLMVLTLNNYSCLEQWKRILGLIFTSKAAVLSRAQFFMKAIRILRLQLSHCEDVEGGLFDLSDDGAGHLKALLRRFKRSVEDLDEITARKKVLDELEQLESYLKDNYQWDIDESFPRRVMMTLEDGEQFEVINSQFDEEDENGEYAPVVVELTETQLQELGHRHRHDVEQRGEEVSEEEEASMDERY